MCPPRPPGGLWPPCWGTQCEEEEEEEEEVVVVVAELPMVGEVMAAGGRPWCSEWGRVVCASRRGGERVWEESDG
jgi:hypothetical protein